MQVQNLTITCDSPEEMELLIFGLETAIAHRWEQLVRAGSSDTIVAMCDCLIASKEAGHTKNQCQCENCRVQRVAVAMVQTEKKRTEEVKTNSDGGRTAHKRFAPPDCLCEDCRVRRAAEKAVLEHGGREYVPEKKFPSIPYPLVGETLCQRILDLIPAYPEILKVRDIWDLFEVPGFECEDLHPSVVQASGALAKAKGLHRQGQIVNPDLITQVKGEQDEVSG